MHEICLVAAPTPPRDSESRPCYTWPSGYCLLPLARATGWFPRVNCYTFRPGPYRASQPPRHRCVLGLAMSRTCSACIEPCGTAHECKDCGTPLCEKVWMPLEGKYFCGNACVVAYNRKKVEEYEEWLEMLPEKGEAEGTAPATIKVRTGGRTNQLCF